MLVAPTETPTTTAPQSDTIMVSGSVIGSVVPFFSEVEDHRGPSSDLYDGTFASQRKPLPPDDFVPCPESCVLPRSAPLLERRNSESPVSCYNVPWTQPATATTTFSSVFSMTPGWGADIDPAGTAGTLISSLNRIQETLEPPLPDVRPNSPPPSQKSVVALAAEAINLLSEDDIVLTLAEAQGQIDAAAAALRAAAAAMACHQEISSSVETAVQALVRSLQTLASGGPIDISAGPIQMGRSLVLAHPDEFKNPSSFLKVYGDPQCRSGTAPPCRSGTAPPVKGQDGNWECMKCHNVNYPRRFRCNNVKCRSVRPTDADRVVTEYARRVFEVYAQENADTSSSGGPMCPTARDRRRKKRTVNGSNAGQQRNSKSSGDTNDGFLYSIS